MAPKQSTSTKDTENTNVGGVVQLVKQECDSMSYVIKKKKLTPTQMKKQGLKYDGWGKKPHGTKDYYYIKKK